MQFEVKGKYFEKGFERKFSKKLKALSERVASEKALALIGSHHKVRRKNIMIEETILLGEENGERE